MGLPRMVKCRITYILSTMWHTSWKKTNRTTKIKMGIPGDEKCKASEAEWRVLAMNRERIDIAYVCQFDGLEG